MAAPAKQTSRWGNFLSQAVAGVESRLDNILAEGVEEQAQIQAQQAGQKKAGTAALSVPPAKTDGGVPKTASAGNRANDRLQERLARAIAAKNSAQKPEPPDSLALSSGVPSRAASPATVSSSPRQSIDAPAPVSHIESKDVAQETVPEVTVDTGDLKAAQLDAPSIAVQPGTPIFESVQEVKAQQVPNGPVLTSEAEASPRPSADSTRSSIPRDSIDSAIQPSLQPSVDLPSGERPDLGLLGTKTPAEYEVALKQLQSDYETSELQRQEEVHGYIERIDALQSKLQYLAKEGAEAARKASGSAPSGSLEKKLADKEEQIALLLEEGQKLSKRELNQLTTIKKLRAKIQEDSKLVEEAKNKQEVAERDVAIVTERWKRAETFEKGLNEKQKENQLLQKEIDTLKSANQLKDSALIELEAELDEAIAQGKEVEMKAANEALEAEKKRAAELEDDIANLKIENKLVADRAQAQIKELREKMEKDLEKARMTKLEMQTEQQMLESKLEVMRARAEEVSSGATGDAQAKLLRQIETLQSQYSVASENWQGIEASLLARASNLEKERDEATRREADIRKKAREVTLKAKRNEDELEESRSKMPSFQQELAEHKAKLDTLQQRAEAAEAALIEAKASFEQEKQAWKSEMQNRIEEERQKLQEEAQTSAPYSYRAESPASTRRGLTSEYLGLQNLQMRRTSGRSVNNDMPPTSGFPARRSSRQPLGKSSGNGTPIRQDSSQSLITTKETQNHNDNHNPNGETTDSPSINTENDDFFEQTTSPSSPHQTINDMISVSTAGAGPSVQLVERMSSAVRRLESEKVATKEDLARLAAQRDEARAEIVALMKEVEQKRELDKVKAELESQIDVLGKRYEITLEMLGEKSERVDELMGDVQDLKAMYRELVETTLK
ncbi:related to transcription factor TMF [Rhynchosporium agropyri]|uniref:Related to transcription factor TMF n=1 Tax=Rhynchosporium agropyri TaxID=914238 RepID=A0A1E1L350_9HELO|nr:related to transcription factor TMF [Rhynchosporium agropyri]